MKKRISEMSAEEKCQAIHDACGLGNRYYLMKRGYYYRPNASGYTDRVSAAGIYTEQEAKARVYPHGDEPVTMHAEKPSDYLADLNAMHEAEKTIPDKLRTKFHVALSLIVSNGFFEHKNHWSERIVHSTASQRADAFLRIIGHEQ